MKLFINVSSIFKGGAEQVAISFINECKFIKDNEYHVVYCDNIGKQLDFDSFPENFYFHKLDKRPGSSLKNFIKAYFVYRSLEKIHKPDCVISTGGHGYWKPKSIPVVGGFNIPHFIYQNSPYFHNISSKKRIHWRLMEYFHMVFYKRLNSIFVQTDDVKNKLRKKIHSSIPITTVSNTVNGHYYNFSNYGPKLGKKKSGEIRLLTLSSYYPHKNLEIIIPVASELIKQGYSNFKFVLTLPSIKFKEIFGSKLDQRIINIGPIPVIECPSLYQECDFMFLPTLLECFSASYAEAMMMKKPILTSDLEFAHTVCKDAAVYFDPINPIDIAHKIIELSNNKKKQFDLIENGLKTVKDINTASERALKFINICNKTINFDKNEK